MADDARVSIRRATEQDAGAIFTMVIALADAVGDQDKVVSSAQDFLKHGFSEPPAFHALIAEQQGRPVGFSLYFYSFSTWLGALGVYLQDLFVDESMRRSGLGARLVSETVKRAQSRGANHLRLSVHHTNVDAQAFYRQLGLRVRDDEHICQADGALFRELADMGRTG